jgi:hypothetical protein
MFSNAFLNSFSQLPQSCCNRNHNYVFPQTEHLLFGIISTSTGSDEMSDDWLEDGGKRDFLSEEGTKVDVDYFFSSRRSTQSNIFNYNVPPELLNDKRIRKAILKDLLSVDYAAINANVPNRKRSNISKNSEDRLMEVSFVGVGSQNVSSTASNNNSPYVENLTCIFVAPPASQQQQQKLLALAVPLNPKRKDKFLSLLSSTYHNMPISQALCLTLNSILVNNEGGLFDNLPWKTWSIIGGHNSTKDYDAAGNRVNVKYRFGKRDAYERFLGKDWPARGSFISWLKGTYGTTKDSEDYPKNVTDTIMFDQQARQVLIRRILELELEEARSMLAEAEQQLAIHLNREKNGSHTTKIGSSSLLSSHVALCKQKLQEVQQAWNLAQQNLQERPGSSNSGYSSSKTMEESNISMWEQFLFNQSRLIENIVNKRIKADKAPYRGAYGYASIVADDNNGNTRNPYKSPFDLLIELIEQQLRSKIIALALENTSYRVSEGIVQLGGVCIIQRQPPQKGSKGQIKIALETVDIPVQEDEEATSNDDEVKTGDVYVVECDAEEAIALSVAAGVPLSIDKNLWESLNSRISTSKISLHDGFTAGKLPMVHVKEDTYYSSLHDKESYDSKTVSTSGASSTRYDVIESITTVEIYDSLSIDQKAEILLKSDLLSEQMPRPRAVLREYHSGESFTILDRLLMPLIDESVRGEYLIREARRRNDVEALKKLKKSRSKRQMAKEMAQLSREGGNPELAEMWENEADFQKSLRVDVTQNEGSYSSLLDKDEWYERQRMAWVSRMKKSGF